MAAKSRFSGLRPEIAAWRRDLHAFDTHGGSAINAEKPQACGNNGISALEISICRRS